MTSGRFTEIRKGAVSAPLTVNGVFGIGYQIESGRNGVPIGLIAAAPLLLSTGSEYVTATVSLTQGSLHWAARSLRAINLLEDLALVEMLPPLH